MSSTTAPHRSLHASIATPRVWRSVVLPALLATGMLTLAGCGARPGYGDASSPRPATSSHSSSATKDNAKDNVPAVLIKDFQYSGDLTVKAGQQVVVTNHDTAPHTLTSTTAGVFDTGTIPAGGTKTFTAPTKPGSYPFGCRFHPSMAGILVVQ